MTKTIRITPIGRQGNWMFQYLLARILQLHVPEAVISGLNLPQFGIVSGEGEMVAEDAHRIEIAGHVFPFADTVEALRRFNSVTVDIRWVCMRMEYFRQHLNFARSLFSIYPSLQSGFDERYLVVHIRAEDVLKGEHPNYTLLPIEWYRHLIESSGLAPVFVGQFSDDPYTIELRRCFPAARFIAHANPFDDFNVLRTSTNVVLSISSFAWLAAWLSTSARRIVLPVAGIHNPLDRPDVDLLPVHDRRYEFRLFQREHWTCSAEQLAARIKGPADARSLRPLSWPRLYRARVTWELARSGRLPAGVPLLEELFAAFTGRRNSGNVLLPRPGLYSRLTL